MPIFGFVYSVDADACKVALFRVMLQVFPVMLHVFPVMLHLFPVMLQEIRATLQEKDIGVANAIG